MVDEFLGQCSCKALCVEVESENSSDRDETWRAYRHHIHELAFRVALHGAEWPSRSQRSTPPVLLAIHGPGCQSRK